MSKDIQPANRPEAASPFDAIRCTDENGEFWSARELMPLLGYVEWRRFEEAIVRAQLAAENADVNSGANFGPADKMVPTGSGAFRRVSDYRLTRYAAYLIAMNGDPRKQQIADAQTYFAIKTREAELSQPADIASLTRREIALLVIEAEDARIAAEAKVAELEPKAEAHDALMTAPGALLVRNAAKTLGMKERALRVFLLEEKLLFTRQTLCGSVQYDFYAQLSNHFRSTLTTVEHTWGECVHTTVHITPQGMGLIRKRLAAQSAEIVAAAGGVR